MTAPLTKSQRNLRHNLKKKDIKEKATALLKEKIRRITTRDKVLYNSLLAYMPMQAFAKQEKKKIFVIIIIMLMDLHPDFNIKIARLWGFKNSMFYKIMKNLKWEGYVIGDRSRRTITNHFLTLKGKLLVKEFNQYYDDRVKEIFRADGIGDRDTVRKVTRVQPARVYKPRDQSASRKPAVNGTRKDP